ncbi:hypothetical protein WNY78_07470 [Psychroserpens sp. AS72]|uniref:hypothetical protein n=1 Tax=Psychroserpens sp. AS72 TaxID=3135775 RepID=UPI003171C5F6
MILLFLATFKLLPTESKLYLITDVDKLRNNILPITIVLSILISFLIIFRKSEFTGGKWSKSFYIFYVLMMSYLVHTFTSDLCMTIALKTNRITSISVSNETFVASTITDNSDGESNSRIWVVMHDEMYEVRGRIAGKLYDNDVDSMFMHYDDFMEISEKKEFEITMQNGIFGIPFKPELIE